MMFIQVPHDKPPPEPPPLQEKPSSKIPHIIERQWTEGGTAMVIQMLQEMGDHHATLLCEHKYTPRIKNLASHKGINKQHLSFNTRRKEILSDHPYHHHCHMQWIFPHLSQTQSITHLGGITMYHYGVKILTQDGIYQ